MSCLSPDLSAACRIPILVYIYISAIILPIWSNKWKGPFLSERMVTVLHGDSYNDRARALSLANVSWEEVMVEQAVRRTIAKLARALSNRRECSRGRRLRRRLQVVTDPPVGIRPEINSHTPREKLFPCLSFSFCISLLPLSVFVVRIKLFPIALVFSSFLSSPLFLSFFSFCSVLCIHLSRNLNKLLMATYRLGAHNRTQKRRSLAIASPSATVLAHSCAWMGKHLVGPSQFRVQEYERGREHYRKEKRVL